MKSLLERLPVALGVQIQISKVISRAYKALSDFGLIAMTPQKERTVDVLLKGFNTKLDSLEDLSLSGIYETTLGFHILIFAEFRTASI